MFTSNLYLLQEILPLTEEVLYKYDMAYSDGLYENLACWQKNKMPLIELLRLHQNWDESSLAIIFHMTDERIINNTEIQKLQTALQALSNDIILNTQEKELFIRTLSHACFPSKFIAKDQSVKEIQTLSGVHCAVGQKTSRVINKICKKYGLDKHPEYNACFARLADALNPLRIERKAILSVYSWDYLEISNQNNSWSSCHCLSGGSYSSGTLSYMNDGVTMIFYTVNNDTTFPYYKAPKITREVFCYQDGVLLQSRLYPNYELEHTKEVYRNIVQKAIAECTSLPNLWTLKRSQEAIHEFCTTHDYALHYDDYSYPIYAANISLLKDYPNAENTVLTIGYRGYCLDCGHILSEDKQLLCDRCDHAFVTCYDCGCSVPENDSYTINDRDYCEQCSSFCDDCNERVLETTEVTNSNGYTMYVCDACLDEYYTECICCNQYFSHSQITTFDGDHYCPACLKEMEVLDVASQENIAVVI